MSDLPKQLQAQHDEAERIEAEMLAQKEAGTEPLPEVVEEEAPVVPPPVVDNWEQKFRTLEGKYRAEVPRLHDDVKALKRQLEEAMSKLIAAATAEKPKTETAKAISKLVTDKDLETFGPDLVDLIKRQATEIAQGHEADLLKVIDELKQKNADLVAQVGGIEETQATSSRSTFLERLVARLPDMEQINADQDFLLWLGTYDELSGLQRQTLLDNAANSGNVERTAAIFEAFKRTRVETPPPTPKPPHANPQRQVEPSKSKNTPAPQSDPGNRIWTVAEMEDFYNDIRKGLYVGKDAERSRTENEIDLAVVQGRLR